MEVWYGLVVGERPFNSYPVTFKNVPFTDDEWIKRLEDQLAQIERRMQSEREKADKDRDELRGLDERRRMLEYSVAQSPRRIERMRQGLNAVMEKLTQLKTATARES